MKAHPQQKPSSQEWLFMSSVFSTPPPEPTVRIPARDSTYCWLAAQDLFLAVTTFIDLHVPTTPWKTPGLRVATHPAFGALPISIWLFAKRDVFEGLPVMFAIHAADDSTAEAGGIDPQAA